MELVLLTPVLVILLLFVVAVGRISTTRGEVQSAARDAARAAANARSPSAAQQAGTAAAEATLTAGEVSCRQLSVNVDPSDFRAGGMVRARVSCTVDLRSVTRLGVPAATTIDASFTAPVDAYRGVSP